jgi:hypothetical protein
VLTDAPLSAANSVIRIWYGEVSQATFEGMEWHVDEQGSEFDCTSFEDDGAEDTEVASAGCTVVMRGLWTQNVAQNPHGSRLKFNTAPVKNELVAGNISGLLTNVRLYLTGPVATGLFWSFPRLKVCGTTTMARVREGLPIEIRCKTRGKWARPGMATAIAPTGGP